MERVILIEYEKHLHQAQNGTLGPVAAELD
jgi:stage V sporulation protein G